MKEVLSIQPDPILGPLVLLVDYYKEHCICQEGNTGRAEL
jgi:hypothetical protein